MQEDGRHIDHIHNFCFRRDGMRPVGGSGCPLIEAGNWQADMPYWHEVAVFQLAAGGFAASLKTFFKGEGQRDAFRAERFANADDVVGWLRGIDPADDLPPESPPRSDDAKILRIILIIDFFIQSFLLI